MFDFDNARDSAVQALIHLQYVSPALAPVIEAVLSPGGCFIDIGASIGVYSLWAAQIVGPTGMVVAFEPAPSTRRLFRTLLATNGFSNVDLIPYAVGDANEIVRLAIDEKDSLQANVVADPGPGTIDVEMVSLDSQLELLPAPTLVKIDVEGHELRVLNGGREVLRRHRPVMIIEAIPDHLARTGASLPDLATLCKELDYRLYDLTPQGLRPCDTESPTMNVLALCSEVAFHREVQGRLSKVGVARNQTV